MIFTTTSNSKLAKSVASKSGIRLGKCDISKFSDKEISILVKEKVKGKKVFCLGSSFPPADNLLELLILINTLKVNGAKKITAIIPYFGYSRSDYIYTPGASLNAKLMAEMVKLAGADKVIVVDLHSKNVEKFFTVPLARLSAMPILAEATRKMKIKDMAIASPDLGGVDRAKEFAKILGIKNIIKIEKCRPKPDQARVTKIEGDIKNKNVIIVDDMIQTGGTVINAAAALKKKGAKDIYVAATHMLYTGPAVANLLKTKNIKQVLATNTVQSDVKKLPVKIKIVPIDTMLSKIIKEL